MTISARASRSVTPSRSGTMRSSTPWNFIYVLTTSATRGLSVSLTRTQLRLRADATIMNATSAVAVAPSYIEALVASRPVSSLIIDWYSKIYCSVPCEISG